MEHHEVGRAGLWTRAGKATMAQLKVLAKILEGCGIEKRTIPLLNDKSANHKDLEWALTPEFNARVGMHAF